VSLSIFDAAREAPDRVALICSGERLTFAELADRAAASIGALTVRGLDGSSSLPRTAVVGSSSLETVCILIALIEMGEPFVLLHPRHTERERAAILDELRPSLILDRNLELGAPDRTPRSIPDERCLAVVYTSGTSGRAKGAILSRRAFMASARASEKNLGWRDDDRWLTSLPLAHVGALSVVTRCLMARRTIVLEEAGVAHVERLAQTMERERVTIASLVPTVLRRLLDLQRPFSHLRAVLLGGAAAPAALLEDAASRRIPVLTTYGLTEACSQVTTQRYGTPPSIEQGAGPPLPDYEVRIEQDQILVRSPSLMTGYVNAPDPFRDGFFPTGDLGRLDEHGRLHVLARRTDLIVTGGENVYPAEVEQVLLAVPGIEAACVFGVPDETWGELVAAALVAKQPSEVEIARHVSVALASFKWPRRIAFLDALPLTSSDKIDRAAARLRAELALRPFDVRRLAS
jgi:O-succinylbenzoic acid--CoA ligase